MLATIQEVPLRECRSSKLIVRNRSSCSSAARAKASPGLKTRSSLSLLPECSMATRNRRSLGSHKPFRKSERRRAPSWPAANLRQVKDDCSPERAQTHLYCQPLLVVRVPNPDFAFAFLRTVQGFCAHTDGVVRARRSLYFLASFNSYFDIGCFPSVAARESEFCSLLQRL